MPTGRPTSSVARCAMVELPARARARSSAARGGRLHRDGVASPPPWPMSRPSSDPSSRMRSASPCGTSTPRSPWHIEGRWDYWQLTRDEPVILAELARFREAGGSGLVDLTLPGVGRDPGWLVGLATASDLHIVMGCGWYRTAYYPAEARIDRRSTDDLADELIREATQGVGESAVRPGIIGEIGTDKPWVSPSEERVHRAAARASRRDRAGHHDARRAVRRRSCPAPHLRGGGRGPGTGRHRPRRFVPVLDHYLALIERGANIEFDFLGMSFTPTERSGEGRVVELLCELLSRGHADRVLLNRGRRPGSAASARHGRVPAARQQLDHAALAVSLGRREAHPEEVELDVRAALDDREVVVEDRVRIGVADHDPRQVGAFLLEDAQLGEPDRRTGRRGS